MASAFLLSTTVTRAGNAECQAGVRPGMDCTLSPRQLSSPTSTAPEAVSTEPTARGALWAQRSRPPCPPNGHGRALDRTLGLGYRRCHQAYAYQYPERPHQRLGSCSPTLGPGEHRSTSPLTDPTGCVGQWLAAFKLTKADVWPGCPCRAQTPADPSSTMRNATSCGLSTRQHPPRGGVVSLFSKSYKTVAALMQRRQVYLSRADAAASGVVVSVRAESILFNRPVPRRCQRSRAGGGRTSSAG